MKSKKKYSIIAFLLMFLFQNKDVYAQVMIGEGVASELNDLIKGPLTTYLSIATAFLLVAILLGLLFQIVRLAYVPDVPIVRAELQRNIASLAGMLVGVGFFSSVGFTWLLNFMLGGVTVGSEVLTSGEVSVTPWIRLLSEYKVMVNMFVGFVALTILLGMILQTIRLGAASGNPQARQKIISGMIGTAIAAALLGGLSTIAPLFISLGTV